MLVLPASIFLITALRMIELGGAKGSQKRAGPMQE
jgi:hypothetical protein